ncbi:MAG: hypothetical protein AB7Q17_01765 [Phycisphaerae bacterium]
MTPRGLAAAAIAALGALAASAQITTGPAPTPDPAATRGAHPTPRDPRHDPPASAPAPVRELPTELDALLATVEDLRFDFDHPAFYALAAHVRSHPPPGHLGAAVTVSDWRELLERPRDYRGHAVTIEGVVGRNRSLQLLSHPELGTLWQLELSRPSEPLACTVVLTSASDDVPLGATVRVTGYFLLNRQYHARAGQVRQAVLLVAPGVSQIITSGAPPIDSPGFTPGWVIAALIVGMIAAWLMLRQRTQRAVHDPVALRARRAAPQNLSADLAAWAEDASDLPGRADAPDADAPDARRATPPTERS